MTIDDLMKENEKLMRKATEDNFCPIKEDCLFYKKPEYHSTTEKEFLVKYCLKGGEGCGLKRIYDKSQEYK